MKLIVSDTSTLITLENLQSLELLCKVFTGVLLPPRVLQELQQGTNVDMQQMLAGIGCIEIIAPSPSTLLDELRQTLDAGEAEAIALAVEHSLPLLLDERKGRVAAHTLNLTVTGFAGLLILATRKQCITAEFAKLLLDQAINNGFRLSDKLYQQTAGTLAEIAQAYAE